MSEEIVKQVAALEYVANERLYLDSTRLKVCKEGDKDCASLLAAKGSVIPLREVERLGLNKVSETKKTVSPDEIKNRATR